MALTDNIIDRLNLGKWWKYENLTQDLHTYPLEVEEDSYTSREAEEVDEIVKPQILRQTVYRHPVKVV